MTSLHLDPAEMNYLLADVELEVEHVQLAADAAHVRSFLAVAVDNRHE